MEPATAPFLRNPLTLPVEDRRRAARSLYWRGWEVSQIAEELEVARTTVQSWKDRGKWDDVPSIRRLEDCLEARWMMLIAKDKKTPGDFKEIDLLGRQVAALAKVRRYEEPGGAIGDLHRGGRRAASQASAIVETHSTIAGGSGAGVRRG